MSAKRTKSSGEVALEKPVCEHCGGYGYIIGDDGVARRCDCGLVDQRETDQRMGGAGVPPLYRTKDFSNFRVERGDRRLKAIVESARSYAMAFHRGEQQGLLLRGAPGCGKTHIAVAILKEIIRRGYTGHYANFNDLLSRLRDSYNQGAGESEGALLGEVDGADLLILDDLGAEMMRDWQRDRLYLIINRRYEKARATIITTNCDEAQLEAHVGARTASRLYEMCSNNFPSFPEEDYRKANMS